MARGLGFSETRRPHHSRHVCAPPQQSFGVVKEFGATFEVPCPTRSISLHHEASGGSTQKKRGAVSAYVDRCIVCCAGASRHKIFAGQLGTCVAGGRNNVRLPVFSRSASSRADHHAGPSTWLSFVAKSLGRNLELEQA